jgi:hypothetical protein
MLAPFVDLRVFFVNLRVIKKTWLSFTKLHEEDTKLHEENCNKISKLKLFLLLFLPALQPCTLLP